MSESEPGSRLVGGQLYSAISAAVVRIIAEYTGRGATRTRTIMQDDWVFVTLEDTLTKGERKLADLGRAEFVLAARRQFQTAMRDELQREIETLTGRKVRAFFSDNHINPDVALEAMLFEPETPAVSAPVR